MNPTSFIGGAAVLASVVLAPATVQAAPATAQSPAATTAKVLPGAPTIVSAGRGGDGAASVNVAAAQTGSATTSIRVTAAPSGKGCTVKVPAASECRITGLSNGTSYTFTATASGPGGTSGASAPSDAVTVARVPFKVTKLVATASVGGEATLTWTAGANGGLPIKGFQVTNPSGMNCETGPDVTSCKFTGLTPGVKYQWTVVAVNQVGSSQASLSNNMTAIGAKRPGSPTVTGMERAGDGKARVSVQPGASNGAPISRMVVRTDALRADGTWSRMATVWCAVTPPATNCVITGLTAGNSYRFLAEATNPVGTSPLSAPSPVFQAG